MSAIATTVHTIQAIADKDRKKENFTEDDVMPLVLLILFIVWVLLVLFLGKTLWNKCLVPAVGVNQVGTMQFLGIFVLIRILFMFMN